MLINSYEYYAMKKKKSQYWNVGQHLKNIKSEYEELWRLKSNVTLGLQAALMCLCLLSLIINFHTF